MHVHLEENKVVIQLPQNRYDEVSNYDEMALRLLGKSLPSLPKCGYMCLCCYSEYTSSPASMDVQFARPMLCQLSYEVDLYTCVNNTMKKHDLAIFTN